ncbi:amino acid ABC transporter permease [Collinsella provencensis]|uniref:amino acid ABC transporter permease n=1 Tax=Collinsella provencensis TaxID=1937461 RepID=UPI000C82B4BB|nr:ABC transporter permease subunit [Collinsella provencensis]
MGLSELLSTYRQNYVDALLATWSMTALCFVFVMLMAVAITVLRVSPFKPLRLVGDLYVQIFRNIPGVSLLVIIVYALPNLNLVLPYRTCVIVTVILVASAFGSENFMSGINTIGVGQIEAARSLGLSFGQILRKIVIPQALRTTVLPMTNLLIAVMLSTSLGSQVPLTPPELTGVVSYINTRSTGGILAFGIAAAGYALTAVAIAFVGNRLDRKVRIKR